MTNATALPSTHEKFWHAMLVCQCNMITSKQIEDIVLELLEQDPWQLVVPAKVYRELERRAKCGGCVPNVVDIIVRVTESFHLQQARSPGELVDVQARLEKLKQKRNGVPREGRTTGHRAA
ncbi:MULTISPECIES: (2Fe-2S)-binding protein [unclassified Devosia]|uniref:(2Fe-2S)-binding protein n=1 Tax=unclassified Devosia TaxID=196773 RepID=UPI0020BFA1D6|nr:MULTISPECIES: (2Fe-2S)-binding protein [unclassified Devosia]